MNRRQSVNSISVTPVFALSNGRSGTMYLSRVLATNLANATCRHEPYTSLGNPHMFGRPTALRTLGELDAIRPLVRRKQRWMESHSRPVYVETSHAFLKSYGDVAMELFPHMKLVHLIRNPLWTARSEANREQWVHGLRLPFRTCRTSAGARFFRWALTGEEPIFQHFDRGALSLFQWYVLQWIEIENRAMAFLDRHDKHADCATLHTPGDLGNADKVAAALRRLGLPLRHETIRLPPRPKGRSARHPFESQNRTPGVTTRVGAEEEAQFRWLVDRVPDTYLTIFAREPYRAAEWSGLLRR